VWIVLAAAQFEPFPPEPLSFVDVVVCVVRDCACSRKCGRAHVYRESRVAEGRDFEPVRGVAILPPVQPEAPEGRSETEHAFAPVGFEQPGERSPKARQLPLEAVERLRAQVAHPGQPLTRIELFGDSEEVFVVATRQRRRIRKMTQLLKGELFDRREHEEAPVLAVPQQALVDQGLEDVEVRVTDGFRRFELEAPDEHG
jgi:hypothetical protein